VPRLLAIPLFSVWDSHLSPSRSWGCVNLSVVRFLGAFNNFIRNDGYAWCVEGLFSFLKYNIGE
jgi:hypothetical protein